jgi:hypothetical protein
VDDADTGGVGLAANGGTGVPRPDGGILGLRGPKLGDGLPEERAGDSAAEVGGKPDPLAKPGDGANPGEGRGEGSPIGLGGGHRPFCSKVAGSGRPCWIRRAFIGTSGTGGLVKSNAAFDGVLD